MRRHNHLYERIISFQNLLCAAQLAQKNKRFKYSTAKFNFSLENELWDLHHQLATKSYEPGTYHHFQIFEPKKRIISAAPYRDRVVHHAIHNILEPIFDPTFIYDSYATRKGKGTHVAINRFQSFAKKCRYALKCDIQQYFPSINHDVLLELIEKKVACKDTLWLIRKILDSSQKYGRDGTVLASLHHSITPSLHQNRYPYRQFNIPVFCQYLLERLRPFHERAIRVSILSALHG